MTNATTLPALAIDVKTVADPRRTPLGHHDARCRRATHCATDRLAADVIGNYFLSDLRVPASDQHEEGGERDKRAMETLKGGTLHLLSAGEKEPLTWEDDKGGGSKNRTCDLSIISAAL